MSPVDIDHITVYIFSNDWISYCTFFRCCVTRCWFSCLYYTHFHSLCIPELITHDMIDRFPATLLHDFRSSEVVMMVCNRFYQINNEQTSLWLHRSLLSNDFFLYEILNFITVKIIMKMRFCLRYFYRA